MTSDQPRKKTEDNHRQDINDPWVLGTRLGGTKAKKKNEDEMTMKTDTKVKETIARVQVGNGAMTSDQPRKRNKKIKGEDGRYEKKDDEREDTINPRDDVYKGDRNKRSDRNKNGDRNTDGRFKANGKIKEWPGTRKGAKTRNIRYIKEEDIGDTSDKDWEKKQSQAKANGGIKKGTSITPASRRARSSRTRPPGARV